MKIADARFAIVKETGEPVTVNRVFKVGPTTFVETSGGEYRPGELRGVDEATYQRSLNQFEDGLADEFFSRVE